MAKLTSQLERLLRLYHVHPAYEDVHQRRQLASVESLLAVLRCLGVEIERPEQASGTVQQRRRELLARGIEPVVVSWNGRAVETRLSLPAGCDRGTVVCQLETGEGAIRREFQLEQLPEIPRAGAGTSFVVRRLRLPGRLPSGYHRLRLETPAGTFEGLVISAPGKAYAPGSRGEKSPGERALPARAAAGGNTRKSSAARGWGCFLPLYALRSERNWGAGDLTDLAELAGWTGRLGGRVIGTLPLLAAFLDQPFEPSPYAPASRLFWNEFYVDVTGIPELADCPAARALLEAADFQEELTQLRRSELVDYRRLMGLKRRVLELLAAALFDRRASRFEEFQAFVERHPAVEDYARFRAACERQGKPWQEWPAALAQGRLAAGEFDLRAMQYHLYAQWIAAEQVEGLARSAADDGCGLYLDLPLGVRRDGYDVWRHQELYATGATAGAPPDAVWTKGQDWMFRPLRPDAIREDGYRHVRSVLEHHVRFARQLRIDHVMSLHRLYWIPDGRPASEGVYVGYRPEEFYAILSLESHRHQCVITGEDLGTVPPEVTRQMERRNLRRMYVVQYELEPERGDVLNPVAARSVASLNTHDMPPFTGWWNGEDIPDRRQLGLLDQGQAGREEQARQRLKPQLAAWLREQRWLDDGGSGAAQPASMIRALLKFLAASPAELVLVNLEDTWLETLPQNTPGTIDQRPNWRRKARYRMEEFRRQGELLQLLQELNELRAK